MPIAWLKKEWAEVGPHFRYDVYRWLVVGAGATALVAAVAFMKAIRGIPEPLFYGATFVISCACFIFLGNRFSNRERRGIVPAPVLPAPPATEQVATTAASSIDVTVIDEFYRSVDNTMLTECEATIRAEIQKHPPADRDRISIRLMAAMMVSYIFETIWFGIFKSQIDAMYELNRHSIKRSDLQPYYDAAYVEYPYVYFNYSFDQWLGWLRSWLLVVESGDQVLLTVRGTAFLKWLVDCRRAAADKTM
jgi:hypothetical protein